MKCLKDDRHEQGIQNDGQCSADKSRIHDPPGCQEVPQQETRIGIYQCTEFDGFFPVLVEIFLNQEQWYKTDKEKSRKSSFRPGQGENNPAEEA